MDIDFTPTPEDLELFGGDTDKITAFVTRVESDRLKARQAVIDKTKTDLQSFRELGLSVDEIRGLQQQKPGESDADVQKHIDKAIQDAQQAQGEKLAARSRAAEVRAVAAELGFNKPTQALALLDQAALAGVTVSDDGEADTATVKKLLEELAKDSPYLLKPTDTTVDYRIAGIGGAGSGVVPEVSPGQARIAQAYASTPPKK